MIKYLITGGCSFSTELGNTWVKCLENYLKDIYPELVACHTAGISQGQELIQKKVILAITEALGLGFDPSEILVSVMWSGTNRKAFYIDNKETINLLLDSWKDHIGGAQGQFISLTDYKDITIDPNYHTKASSAYYNPEGGWYYTTDGSDSIDGIKEFYLLDRESSGPGKVHISLENMIFLQNFCNLKQIRFLQQIYMNDVYEDILAKKDHPIINYLFRQLDMKNFVTVGLYEFTLEKSQHESGWFESDNLHPSSKANLDYFKNLLQPYIDRLL